MRQELGPLGTADILTAKELKTELGHHFSALVRQFYRADKFMRVPMVTGSPSAGALNIVSTVGPYQGYAWDISMLAVSGLTRGGSPDVVQMYLNGGPNVPWWEFNGNNWAYTFSRGQMVMLGGETITLQSVGTFAATGAINLYGMIRTETPTVKLGSVLA